MIFKTQSILGSLLLLLFLMVAGVNRAQPGKPVQRERIEALRVSFLTSKLDLSPKEAQSFWPLYNEYQDKLEAARRNRRAELKATNFQGGAGMNEAEANKFVDAELAFHAQESQLMKQYYEQFRKVLPASKVAMLLRAEEEFKKELLKQLKDKN